MRVPFTSMTFCGQAHGDEIAVVEKRDVGRGLYSKRDAFTGRDAMITNLPRITLCVLVADCLPVLLVDPVRKAVAAAHLGWKGTTLRLSEKVVVKMGQEYASKAEDCLAVLGPSICAGCYDVDGKFFDFPLVRIKHTTRLRINFKHRKFRRCLDHRGTASEVLIPNIEDFGPEPTGVAGIAIGDRDLNFICAYHLCLAVGYLLVVPWVDAVVVRVFLGVIHHVIIVGKSFHKFNIRMRSTIGAARSPGMTHLPFLPPQTAHRDEEGNHD